jgi:hypothetical protein
MVYYYLCSKFPILCSSGLCSVSNRLKSKRKCETYNMAHFNVSGGMIEMYY